MKDPDLSRSLVQRGIPNRQLRMPKINRLPSSPPSQSERNAEGAERAHCDSLTATETEQGWISLASRKTPPVLVNPWGGGTFPPARRGFPARRRLFPTGALRATVRPALQKSGSLPLGVNPLNARGSVHQRITGTALFHERTQQPAV